MMANDKRNYSMSDPDLVVFTAELCIILTENLADLTKYGLSAPKIAALEALGDAFQSFYSDAYYANHITGAVIDRNQKRKDVERKIRTIAVRVQEELPDKAYKYEEFGAARLQGLSLNNFLVTATEFVGVAGEELAALAGEGLAQPEIDALEAAVDAYKTALHAVNAKVRLRSEKKAERIENGNEIYDLVKKYAAYGKNEYVDNPTQYAKFVIYADAGVPQTPPDAPAIEVVDGTAEAIFEQEVTSMVMLMRTDPNAAFEEIHDGPNVPVLVGEGYGYLEIQAFGRNAAGNGAVGSKIIYGVTQPPTNVEYNTDRLEWETDASIESVEIEASYDGGATFNEIATVVGANEYVWTPPSGPIVFRVRSKRGGEYSTWVVYSTVIP